MGARNNKAAARGVVVLLAALGFASCGGVPGADAVEDASSQATDSAARRGAELGKITLTVPNMVCPLCANTIEHTLEEAGLRSVAVDLETKHVVAMFDPERITADQVKKLITDLGYTASNVKVD